MMTGFEWKDTMCLSLAQYVLEGHTDEEVFTEFGEDKKWLSCRKKEIRQNFPEKYALMQKKEYLVFQRMIYQKQSLEEARKAFKVSALSFDKYMDGLLKDLWNKNEKRAYIQIKAIMLKKNH